MDPVESIFCANLCNNEMFFFKLLMTPLILLTHSGESSKISLFHCLEFDPDGPQHYKLNLKTTLSASKKYI